LTIVRKNGDKLELERGNNGANEDELELKNGGAALGGRR
jgi:hypothetical protein